MQNKCYLSSHVWFNDPYDCKAFLTLKGSGKRDVAKYLDDAIATALRASVGKGRDSRIANHLRTPKGRRSLLQDYSVDSPQLHDLIENLRPLIDRQTEKTGFLCLARRPDDILMWSHYADGHKGLCLQFDRDVLGRLEDASLEPVEYIAAYPTLKELVSKPFRNNWPAFFLTRKSAHWRYERELRLIAGAEGGVDQVKAQPLQLPSNALTAAILGCRMAQREKDKIRCWAARRKKPIKVLGARLKKDSYGLDIPGLI